MKINRATIDQAVNNLWFTFLKTEKSWINKLYRWLEGSDSDFYFDDYIKFLVSLRQQTFSIEISFWVRLLRNIGMTMTDFEVRFWKKSGDEIEVCYKSARIPTESQITDLIQKSTNVEKVFLLILHNSGRRSVDIARINSDQVKQQGSKYYATIPKDKTHQNSVTFSWSWSDSPAGLNFELSQLRNYFQHLLESEKYPFQNVKINAIRKSISWRLHGLRHRKAIQMIRSGHSVHETMSSIGWSSVISFTRYTKLAVLDLKSFSSTENCIKFIND